MRTRWVNLLVLLSLVLGLLPVTAAQAASETSPATQPAVQAGGKIEVEPALISQLAADQTTGYLIYFREKPDLSPAYKMDWIARGRFVANALHQAALRSQARVRAYLDARGVKYKAFWIQNVISVESSNRATVDGLMNFPEISALRQHRQLSLIEPQQTLTAPTAPQAIEPNILHVLADQVWAQGYTGQGIVVANVDTGVRYSHDALVRQYRGNLGGSFDHNYNWWDPYGDHPTTPGDDNGHGTHTMGTTVGDDGGANQIGMAPGAQWIACRACNTNQCSDTALLECAEFIAAPWDLNKANANPDKRPNVVNNSWGDCGQSYDPWYQDAVDAWHAAGIYPVFSNGNASNCGYPQPPGLNTVGNPARYGNVTGVGSTGRDNGQYATHSNWGPTDNPDTVNPHPGWEDLKPQVLAPGVNIRSSVNTGDSAYQGGWSGTSMSAPHVTGLIALMWQAAPCLVGDYATTENIIENTATPIPYDDGTGGGAHVPNYAAGWGEINALAAVMEAASSCGDSAIAGQVTDATTSAPVGAATIWATSTTEQRKATSDANGFYVLTVFSDTYTLSASRYGYQTTVIPGVVATTGATTTQNIALTPAAYYEVSGHVTDATTGWPLYAHISITGDPFNPIAPANSVWTDPATGAYSVMLAEGITYTFAVSAWAPGYVPTSGLVGPLTTDATANFALQADLISCSAPGYTPIYTFYDDFESGYGNWTMGGLWNAENQADLCGSKVAPFPSPDDAVYYGDDLACNYNVGTTSGSLRLVNPVAIPAQGGVLTYSSYEQTECGGNCSYDKRYTEISTNGGSTWTVLAEGEYEGSWYKRTFDLTPYANKNVLLRFRFDSGDGIANAYFGWMVDNVGITTGCAAPTDGGLVVGNVYDENYPTVALNGAAIVNEAGYAAESVPTPLDAAVDDGFYTIFAPSGTQTFTATTTGGYGADVVDVAVVDGNTVVQDFFLPAGLLRVTPPGLDVAIELGYADSRTLNLTNEGSVGAAFEIAEKETGFAPIGPFEKAIFQIGSLEQSYGPTAPQESSSPAAVQPFDAGDVIQTWPSGRAAAWGIAYNGLDETVWVGDGWGTEDAIFEYEPDGTPTGVSQPYTWSPAYGPADAAFNWNTGMLWMMDVGGDDCIHEIDPSTGVTGNTICPGFAISQRGLAYDPATDTYFAGSWNDQMIHRFDANGNMLADVNVGLSISGLAYNPDTQHLFVQTNGGAADAYVLDVANNYALIGQFHVGSLTGGAGLEIGCDGSLWAVDQSNEMVYQVESGEDTTVCGQDVPWLSETPVTGAVAANGSRNITVNFDAAYVDQPGEYHADLIFKNDTPYGKFNVPVTMTVAAPTSWGKLTGTVISLGVCDANPVPVEEAEVFVESATTGRTWLVTTGADGVYHLWMDQAHSPLTITVTAPDHFGQVDGVVVVQGQETVVDFDLRLLKPCLRYSPAGVAVTLPIGHNTVEPLTLHNTGAGDAEFELREVAGGFVPLHSFVQMLLASQLHPERPSPADYDPNTMSTEGLLLSPGTPALGILGAGDVLAQWNTGLMLPWGTGYSMGEDTVWLGDPMVNIDYEFATNGAPTGRTVLPSFGGSWAADIAYNPNTGMFWQVNVGGDNCIYEWDPASGATGNKVCGSAWTWTSQRGLAYDPTTDTFFVGGWNDSNVYRIDNTGAVVQQWGLGLDISGLAYNHEAGYLFIIENSPTDTITVFDVTSGSVVDTFTVPGFGNYAGAGLEVDCDGNLWAANQVNLNAYLIDSGVPGNLCTGGGIPWLSESPDAGTIPADSDAVIDLTFDAGVPETMQPGTYTGQLKVAGNAANDVPNVPVTLTVTPPPTWGKLMGAVTGLGYCDAATPVPLEDAEIIVESGTGLLAWMLTTDANGAYQFWLDAAHSPVTVTITHPDHVTQVFTNVVVTAGGTTVVDAALRWNQPCLTVDPALFDITVEMGMSTTLPFSLTNGGAANADFVLQEADGGVRPMAAPPVLWASPIYQRPASPVSQVAAAEGMPQSLTEFIASGLPAPKVEPAAPSIPSGAVQGIGFYYDRGAFNADYPGLPVEGYENGTMPYASVDDIPHPLDEFSDNAYFNPGDVLPGIQFWATTTHSGDEIAVLGQQFFSNPSKTAVANYFADSYRIVFNPPVYAAGMDIQEFMGGYSCQVDVYTTGGGLLGSDVTGCNEAGVFWGVASDADPIAEIVITSLAGGAQGADNIAFGGSLAGIPWLSEDPESDTVPPDSTFGVALTFDASVPEVTQPGEYFGTLFVTSNDPVNNRIPVPVTMTVEPPATWGRLMGTVTSFGYCDANPAPLAGADVLVESWMTETVEVASTVTLLNEAFEGAFPPAGWSVADNAGTGHVWYQSATNYTNGSGYSAAADSDSVCDGVGWDTELWSPPIDLTGVSAPLLTYQSNFQDYAGAGEAWLDVSTNGGGSWTNLTYWTEDYGPTFETVDLSAYVGQTIVLRWRYSDNNDGCAWYWHIDDVLVTGEVTALVERPVSWSLTTDISGTYRVWLDEMYSPVTITVTYPDHQKGEATATVVAGATTTQDFALRWLVPCVGATPSSFHATLELGATATEVLTLTNTGAVDTPFELREQDRGFAPLLLGGTIQVTVPAGPTTAPAGTMVAQGPYTARPATTYTIARHVTAGATPDVLLLHADDGNGEPIRSLLQAYGDLGVVNLYDARTGTPTLAELQAYDVVLTWSNYNYANASAIGDVLADYVDSGGKVVDLNFALDSSWGMQGRFVTENYTAMVHGSTVFATSCLGAFNPAHPIMTGITNVCDYYRIGSATLTPGSSAVAWWGDGYLFVAAKDNRSVASINAYPGFYYQWTGQMSDVVHNAILWLAVGADVPWLSESPITGTLVAETGLQLVDVTFDAGVPEVAQPGDYYATLEVHSDDPYAPTRIPVTMTVTPPTSWGRLLGTVYSLGRCSLELNPIADAEVIIWDDTATAVVTLTTDANGAYSYWLPNGAYTVTVTAADHLGDYAAVTVPASDQVTQDFSLTWLGPCVTSIAPSPMEVTVGLGMSTTLPLTITNAGAGGLDFEFQEKNGGFVPMVAVSGHGEWLYQTTQGVATQGVEMQTNQGGTALAYPSAYRWEPAAPSAVNVLVYADDFMHSPPNTYVDQALQALGIAYTAYYGGDFTGFANALATGGPWDLVIFENANYNSNASPFPQMLAYVQSGGKLAAEIWTMFNDNSDPLYAEMGVAYVANDLSVPSVHWWEPDHAIFNNPQAAPEWLSRYCYATYSCGQYLDPMAGVSTALAGYTTPGPDAGQGALILRDDGRAVFKGFSDTTTDADSDGDGMLDGAELWMNIITGLLEGFGSDIPWLFEDPETGTVPAATAGVANITFDASVPEVVLPGDYFGLLTVKNSDPVWDGFSIPVTMHVTLPETYGLITGTVTGLGPCDDPLTAVPLEGAQVTIESATRTWTRSTDATGSYFLYLDEAHSPLTITATMLDYVGQVVTDVVVISGTTTVRDIALRPLAPCLGVMPADAHVTLAMGMSTTVPIDVVNSGAAALDWSVKETDGGFVVLSPLAAGGPDAFGYTFMDSNEPDGPDYGWIEIAPSAGGGGTSLGMNGVDDGYYWPLTLPFAFNFYGTDYTQIAIASNGTVYFQDTYLGLGNVGIPGSSGYGVDTFIAHLWDDLYVAPGDVYYMADGDKFIIEYYQVSGCCTTADHATWEIILFANGSILLQYQDAYFASGGYDYGASATIGIQGDTMTGLQYSYNTPSLSDNLAICFAYPGESPDCRAAASVPWLDEDPTSGTVGPDATAPVTLTFDASVPEVTQPGDYYATLTFKGGNGEVEMPVTMTVEVPPTWGKLGGLVQTLGYCDVMTAPLEGAVVFVESTVTSDTWTVTTGANGMYGVWLDEMYSPLTVTIAHEGGYAERVFTGVEIVSGTVTTLNANLTWLQPCITVAPEAMALSVPMGTSTTVPLDLANMGAVNGMFLINERSKGFNPLGPLATGGPDAFGYQYADSNDLGIRPVYDFVDISGVGTALTLGDNDYAQVDIGFDFKFYGASAVNPNLYNKLFVGSNGFLTFDAGSTDISPDPVLPDPTLPDNLIAAAWYNLVPGTVYVQSFVQCPYNPDPDTVDACFIVQYDGFTHVGGAPAGTWEVILFRSGSILMQYADVDVPGATIGIESPFGLDGLTYVPTLADELAICFAYPGEWLDCQSTQVPWLETDVVEGNIAAYDDVTVDVTLDASVPEVAAPGDYLAELWVFSNDPINSVRVIPVTMTVEMPTTMTKLWGNVYGWGHCDAVSQTLPGAQINIQTANGVNHVLTADATGAYAVWVEAGPVTMTVWHEGYVSTTVVDTVAPGIGPQRDMHVYLDAPCIGVTYEQPFDVVVVQGQQLTRMLTINNRGSGLLTYNNALATGLWLTVAPKTGSVAPRGTQSVNVIFDATGLAVGVYNSSMEIIHNDAETGRVFVRPIRMTVVADGTILLPLTDAKEGNPGETVTYAMTLTNIADVAVTFDIAATGNVWTTTVPATVTVPANSAATFDVDVEIPVDAHTGDSDTVTITAESQGEDGQIGVAILHTTVAEQPVVLALTKTAAPADYVLPGDTITYTIVMANNGNDPITIALTDPIPAGTTYVLESVTGGATFNDPPGNRIVWDGTLAKGAQHTITFRVTVDAGLALGTLITNTVTATVDSVPYTAQATVRVGRPMQYIYLPLVLRNAQ